MDLDRRSVLRYLSAGGFACALPVPCRPEPAVGVVGQSRTPWRHAELANGLRLHVLTNDTGYVSGSLLLRARQITFEDGGLAHIMEHTSFTGAAGDLSAADLKNLHKDVIQESNASTHHGAIQWDVSFLPEFLPQVLHILSVTSLDQKFDEATVASEAKVVLQELYLDKYAKADETQKRFFRLLYGGDHPYACDTAEKEIAKAKTPPAELAAELRRYAGALKLPANMDLVLAGSIDFPAAEAAARRSFGAYPFARAPMFDFPRVATTRAYHKLAGPSHDLSRPMCELVLAWNTGVCLRDPHACILLALREYLDAILFLHLRERYGEAYTPEIEYVPDSCSGVFTIKITSSADASRIERGVFESIDQAKQSIDLREVARFAGRKKLDRLKGAHDNASLVKRFVEATTDSASIAELSVETVSPEDLLMAARHYLPVHRGAYVRLALRGQ